MSFHVQVSDSSSVPFQALTAEVTPRPPPATLPGMFGGLSTAPTSSTFLAGRCWHVVSAASTWTPDRALLKASPVVRRFPLPRAVLPKEQDRAFLQSLFRIVLEFFESRIPGFRAGVRGVCMDDCGSGQAAADGLRFLARFWA